MKIDKEEIKYRKMITKIFIVGAVIFTITMIALAIDKEKEIERVSEACAKQGLGIEKVYHREEPYYRCKKWKIEF